MLPKTRLTNSSLEVTDILIRTRTDIVFWLQESIVASRILFVFNSNYLIFAPQSPRDFRPAENAFSDRLPHCGKGFTHSAATAFFNSAARGGKWRLGALQCVDLEDRLDSVLPVQIIPSGQTFAKYRWSCRDSGCLQLGLSLLTYLWAENQSIRHMGSLLVKCSETWICTAVFDHRIRVRSKASQLPFVRINVTNGRSGHPKARYSSRFSGHSFSTTRKISCFILHRGCLPGTRNSIALLTYSEYNYFPAIPKFAPRPTDVDIHLHFVTSSDISRGREDTYDSMINTRISSDKVTSFTPWNIKSWNITLSMVFWGGRSTVNYVDETLQLLSQK
jgi:hypothetical protein